MPRGRGNLREVAYRDDLEALRARIAALEAERDAAREEAGRLEAILKGEPATRRRARAIDPRWRSIPGGEPTRVTIRNESRRKIEVIWLSYDGRERSAGTLVPGGVIREQTYVGHCWRMVDARSGEVLAHTHVEKAGDPVIVFEDAITEPFALEDEPAAE